MKSKRKHITVHQGELVGSSNPLKYIQSKRLIMAAKYVPGFIPKILSITPIGPRVNIHL